MSFLLTGARYITGMFLSEASSSLELPPELEDMILDCLIQNSDHRTLARCGLVSKGWLEKSRWRYFASRKDPLLLYTAKECERNLPATKAAQPLFNPQCTLLPYITELGMETCRPKVFGCRLGGPAILDIIISISPVLSNLRTLHLSGVGIESGPQHPGLAAIGSALKLTSIHLKDVTFFSSEALITFLNSLPNLDDTCELCNVMLVRVPGWHEAPRVLFKPKPSLRFDITLDGQDGLFMDFIAPLIIFHDWKVRKLKITSPPIEADDVELTEMLIEHIGPHLEELELEVAAFSYSHTPGAPNPNSFAKCESLAVLKIGKFSLTSHSIPSPWLSTPLSSMPASSKFRNVGFSLDLKHSNSLQNLDQFNWSSIEETLTDSEKFSDGIPTVQIDLCGEKRAVIAETKRRLREDFLPLIDRAGKLTITTN